MSDFTRFRASTGALRDDVVAALNSGNLGKAIEGLGSYRELAFAVSKQSKALGSDSPAGWREWREVLSDLFVIVDVATTVTSTRTWIEVVSWCREVAVDFLRAGDLPEARELLALVQHMWSVELDSARPDNVDRRAALLLRVSEISVIGSLAHSDGNRSDLASLAAATVFANLLRSAIAAADEEAAVLAMNYFDHSLYREEQAHLRGATALVIYGWILFLVDKGESADMERLRLALSRSVAREIELLEILELAQSDEIEGALGWHMWEMRGLGPVQGGLLELSHYVDIAAVFLSNTHRVGSEGQQDVDQWAADRLVKSIDALREGKHPRLRELLSGAGDDDLLRGPRQRLQERVDAANVLRRNNAARVPLDGDRVESFLLTLQTALGPGGGDSLVQALTEGQGEKIADVAPNFGYDRLVPRDYFAPTGVIAEQEWLARDVAGGVIRAEQEHVLKAVLPEAEDGPRVNTENLTSLLREELSRSEKPVIIVTNSFSAGRLLTKDEGDWTPAAPPLIFDGVRVVQVFDDRSFYVALLPRDAGIVSRATLQPVLPSDRVVDEVFLIGVSKLTDAEIQSTVERQSLTPLQEANLRASVRVRALEHLVINPPSDESVRLWWIDGDVW